MIATALAVTLPGFALGAAGMWLGTRSSPPHEARRRWSKLAAFFVIVHGLVACAAAGRWVIGFLAVVMLGFSARELWDAWGRMGEPKPRRVWLVFGLAVAGVADGVANASPGQVLFIFLCVAACDGFSQVVGQYVGRTPLAPVVSPHKTLEGFLGGLVGAVSVAVLLRGLVPMPVDLAVVSGAGIAASGLAGDLAASWVKRRAGMKDFGSRLPGQGGVLDRFDSFIGAMGVSALALRLFGA